MTESRRNPAVDADKAAAVDERNTGQTYNWHKPNKLDLE